MQSRLSDSEPGTSVLRQRAKLASCDSPRWKVSRCFDSAPWAPSQGPAFRHLHAWVRWRYTPLLLSCVRLSLFPLSHYRLLLVLPVVCPGMISGSVGSVVLTISGKGLWSGPTNSWRTFFMSFRGLCLRCCREDWIQVVPALQPGEESQALSAARVPVTQLLVPFCMGLRPARFNLDFGGWGSGWMAHGDQIARSLQQSISFFRKVVLDRHFTQRLSWPAGWTVQRRSLTSTSTGSP